MKAYAPVLCLALLAAGCAAVPSQQQAPAPTERESADSAGRDSTDRTRRDAQTDPATDAPAMSSAAAALQEEAAVATRNGDHARAAALLERALRVEPRNPRLWYELAMVHYAQDDYAQAEQLALRANGFASNQPELQQRSWTLIARCRERSGDGACASEARQRAAALGGR